MKRVFNTKRELAEALLEGEKWKLGLVEHNPHQKLIDKYGSGDYIKVGRSTSNWMLIENDNWFEYCKYRLIHKKHKEVLEHWLDGGEVEVFVENKIQGLGLGDWRELVDFIEGYNESFDYRIKPKQNNWIPHNGGVMPIDGDVLVEVEFRCGEFSTDVADKWYWLHGNKGSDIIAYRIIEEPEELERIATRLANDVGEAFAQGPKDLDDNYFGEESYTKCDREQRELDDVNAKLEALTTKAIKQTHFELEEKAKQIIIGLIDERLKHYGLIEKEK